MVKSSIESKPPNVRRAREDEAEALSTLATASKAHWAYSQAQLAAWQDGLNISPEMVRAFPAYVAESNEHIVGCFLLVPEKEHWQLEHFWVHPSCMGKGVGRLMLSEATRIAAESGVSHLLIEADPNAEAFYIACGADRIGQIPAPIDGASQRVLPLLALATEQPNPTMTRTTLCVPTT